MKIYQYGDCIPETKKLYHKLKRQGKKSFIVEGWVTVKNPELNYDYYMKKYPHTWLEYNSKIIDITKNQFDIYGGIKKYIIKEKYFYQNRKEKILH